MGFRGMLARAETALGPAGTATLSHVSNYREAGQRLLPTWIASPCLNLLPCLTLTLPVAHPCHVPPKHHLFCGPMQASKKPGEGQRKSLERIEEKARRGSKKKFGEG